MIVSYLILIFLLIMQLILVFQTLGSPDRIAHSRYQTKHQFEGDSCKYI